MKQIRKRLTYANVMSSIAVFLVLGGAAFAAAKLPKNSVGTKQLKNNAVTTAKIKNNAVSGGKIQAGAVDGSKLADGSVANGKLADNSVSAAKIGDGSVSTGKIADNAVTTSKLADSSVTSGKLAEAERSQAFVAKGASGPSPQLSFPIAETATPVATLNLPAGHFVVTAETEIIRSLEEESFTECFLSDDGSSIATMSTLSTAALIFPSGGVSMTGVSDGGSIVLSCKSSRKNTFAFEEQIIATRVGSVTG